MQCITPLQVRNKSKDYKDQNLYSTVPCGKCVPCLKRRASHWSFRINEEAKHSSSAYFLTLTYEITPTSDNGYPTLYKKDFQNFLKRLRKLCPTNKLKYYACGEYGTQTQRPHYHAIILNLPKSIGHNPILIQDTWQNGHVMSVPSNQKTINYVVGYMCKGRFEPQSDHDDRSPEFSLMSKKMGMQYLTDKMVAYYRNRQIACIVKEGGQIMSMPRYYKEKIFTKQELKKINDEYMEINKLKIENYFKDSKHEIEFKKQLIKQDAKERRQKRVAI